MRLLAANVDTMQISWLRRSCQLLGLIVVLASCAGLLLAQEPIETIRIDSDLVDLKVSVLGLSAAAVPLLGQTDFVVLEDGTPQEITFFAAADAPFDLVLLLDLSGSNSKKLKMIRNSAKRFIDATRSIDRIALVTFTDQVALYSSFTHDRRSLKDSIDDIDEAVGGTNFWDALDFVLRQMVVQSSGLRRSAVVVMTDGIDNALPDVPGPGSRISYEKLLDEVRSSESIVVPIYLDTEEENVKHHGVPRAAYALAREQLGQLAGACGTNLYQANKLSDLDRLYTQVIRDLSTVYTIGYRPANRTFDGKWRTVDVQLLRRPDLFARTKRGYYAKLTP
jgi:VWFA-related protein